jgi:AcrR family transcriptional regulator
MTKAEKTREYIIEKTADIFNKKGYAGTSLSDLTEATGLTKGALYGNFKNKDEIALAVYDYNIRRVRHIFTAAHEAGTGAIERLLQIPIYYKKNFIRIVEHGGCPLLNAAVEADDNQALLKEKVNATIADWKKNIMKTIQKGIDTGEIKAGVEPSKYACIFIALFEGGVMLSKSTGDFAFLNHSLDRMTDIINTELKQ